MLFEAISVMKSAFVFLSVASVCCGQPIIYAVANAASNLPFKPSGFQNSSLAQGAMFVVEGTRLGPASIVVAESYPLQTILAGTSVQIVVGGVTTDAIMYYAESQAVAAILPSPTPLGAGYVKVSYNGSSNSFPINVVQDNVAMYTVGQTGSGDAVVTLVNNSVVLPDNSPNPGDVVVFWANGLGPVSYDETIPAAGGDMVSVALEVFIGGQPATVLYRGRSPCCASLDQVNVQIPDGITTGCVVSVVMRIGNLVSNTTTMPIASSGRVCTPTNPAISQGDVQRLMGKASIDLGIFSLERSVPRSDDSDVDILSARLRRFTALPSLVLDEVADVPAPGSCTVAYNFVGNPAYKDISNTVLDDGPVVVTGGGSTVELDAQPKQYLTPGPYTVAATGGTDVAAFQVGLTVPQSFTWTNPAQGNVVDRSQPLTLTWSGADPSGYVIVSGYGQDSVGEAYFSCTGRASDEGLTVPPFILEALPTFGTVTGAIQIESLSPPVAFSADGLDLGLGWAAEYDADTLGYVQFQ